MVDIASGDGETIDSNVLRCIIEIDMIRNLGFANIKDMWKLES